MNEQVVDTERLAEADRKTQRAYSIFPKPRPGHSVKK